MIHKLGLGCLAWPGDHPYLMDESSSGEGFVVIQYLVQGSRSHLGTKNIYLNWKVWGHRKQIIAHFIGRTSATDLGP